MSFNDKNGLEFFGRFAGFFGTYLFFTISLFLILTWLGKLPKSWSLLNFAPFTSLVVLIGFTLTKFYKS